MKSAVPSHLKVVQSAGENWLITLRVLPRTPRICRKPRHWYFYGRVEVHKDIVSQIRDVENSRAYFDFEVLTCLHACTVIKAWMSCRRRLWSIMLINVPYLGKFPANCRRARRESTDFWQLVTRTSSLDPRQSTHMIPPALDHLMSSARHKIAFGTAYLSEIGQLMLQRIFGKLESDTQDLISQVNMRATRR